MPRILIVDDSKTVRSTIGRMLQPLSVESEEAENGKECIEKIESGNYDALLLDWNMPIMSGFDCLTHVRADSSYKELRVIMVTTESEFDRISEALAAGADDYIIKPFDQDILREKLALVGLNV